MKLTTLTSHLQQFLIQREFWCHLLQFPVSRLFHLFVLLDDPIVSGSHRQVMDSLTLAINFLSVRVQFRNELLRLSPHTLLVLIQLLHSFLPLEINIFDLLQEPLSLQKLINHHIVPGGLLQYSSEDIKQHAQSYL